MSFITDELIAISNAVRGEDVRTAIYNALQKLDNEISGMVAGFDVYGENIIGIENNETIGEALEDISDLETAIETKASQTDVSSCQDRLTTLEETANDIKTVEYSITVSWSSVSSTGSSGQFALYTSVNNIDIDGYTPIGYVVGPVGISNAPSGYGIPFSVSYDYSGKRKLNIAFFRTNNSAVSERVVKVTITYIKNPVSGGGGE